MDHLLEAWRSAYATFRADPTPDNSRARSLARILYLQAVRSAA